MNTVRRLVLAVTLLPPSRAAKVREGLDSKVAIISTGSMLAARNETVTGVVFDGTWQLLFDIR